MKKMVSWDQAVKFHGHSCFGLAMGYRVAEAALKELQSDRDVDEEIVAIVENDNCSVDAVQYVTGCTMGKGNLFFHDHGKPVYTFIRRSDNKAVRIVAHGPDEKRFPELAKLRQKAQSNETTEDDQKRLSELTADALQQYLDDPLDKVVEIQRTTREIPEKARIFNSIICADCGEKVMEPRARIKNGQPVCIPCAEEYGSRV
ncbi:MAG: FmdE family protein [Bacillota bacterium]